MLCIYTFKTNILYIFLEINFIYIYAMLYKIKTIKNPRETKKFLF